jgi:hypothetical protein
MRYLLWLHGSFTMLIKVQKTIDRSDLHMSQRPCRCMARVGDMPSHAKSWNVARHRFDDRDGIRTRGTPSIATITLGLTSYCIQLQTIKKETSKRDFPARPICDAMQCNAVDLVDFGPLKYFRESHRLRGRNQHPSISPLLFFRSIARLHKQNAPVTSSRVTYINYTSVDHIAYFSKRVESYWATPSLIVHDNMLEPPLQATSATWSHTRLRRIL